MIPILITADWDRKLNSSAVLMSVQFW